MTNPAADLPASTTAPGRVYGEPRAAGAVLTGLGLVAAAAAPAVALFLLLRALGLCYEGALGSLFDHAWFPGEGRLGILPLILGSTGAALLGLTIAAPLGLGTAIWLRFYARRRAANACEAALGVLAGTPSVVFGLFGTYWVLPVLGALHGGEGRTGSLLAAGIVLAMMIVPSFAVFALAALRQVPDGLLRDGAALGLSRAAVIRSLALRAARPGLIGAATLALARALGEALAVEMVAGNVPNLPTSLLQPVRTLTATLVQEFEYARGVHADALHLVALTVVALAALLTSIAFRLGRGPAITAPEAG